MRVANDLRIRTDHDGKVYLQLRDDEGDEMASVPLRDLAAALQPYLAEMFVERLDT